MLIFQSDYFFNTILKTSEETVESVLREKNGMYKTYKIPKNGGEREISALPKGCNLYKLQTSLLKNFLLKISLPVAARGFVKGESYNSYLSVHLKKRYYLRMDIADFFGSIKKEHLQENLAEFVRDDKTMKVIAELCTYHDKVPQGAVCSPALSNIVFRRIDQRITKYCQALNVEYSRYADDLLFSSDSVDFKEQRHFKNRIGNILVENRFKVNFKKTRFGEGEIVFAGYVLGNNIHLSRKKLAEINKVIKLFRDEKKASNPSIKGYHADKNFIDKDNWLNKVNELNLKGKNGQLQRFGSKSNFLDYLCGYRAFIISIMKENSTQGIEFGNDSDMRQLGKKISKLEAIITTIENSPNC